MRRYISLFLLLVAFDIVCGVSTANGLEAVPDAAVDISVKRGFADLADRLLPSVVNISTEQTVESEEPSSGGAIFGFPPGLFPRGLFEGLFNGLEPFVQEQPKPRKVVSLGSGFIVDKSGLIVTNYHVIANAQDIQIKFSDGSTTKAAVIGTDPKTDLAVLKVNVEKDLDHVRLGNSDNARVGEWVLAIGNPFGLGGSVSVGIISGRSRDINIGTASEFLQTDAAINRGHSGGPLFNAQGEVIGVNTAIISLQDGGNVGVAFAIPSNNAARIIDVLSRGEKVEHGWLGVVAQRVTEGMKEALGLDEVRGALISNVVKDSPAEKGGIKVGDVILEFNGKKIDDMPQLTYVISRTGVNKKVKVVVLRDKQLVNLKVVVGKLPEGQGGTGVAADTGAERLGITVGNLPQGKSDSKVDGVLILKVDVNSDAYAEGIRRGDILVGIDSAPVTSVADLTRELERLKEKQEGSVVLLLVKKGESPPIYVPVRLKR